MSTIARQKYIIVSPVKDEQRTLERTIESVVSQTVRPHKWVIVDDGSTDATPQILKKFTEQHEWIRVVRRDSSASRQPGGAVIQAFRQGFEAVKDEPFDFVVKLDCDVELPPFYFEFLLARFQEKPVLGICSGVYQEFEAGRWQVISMPAYHAAGASKVMRAECFRQIGGFVVSRGWDTVDEIKAQVLGWHTQHFHQLVFSHLKKEGSGIGSVKTNAMHGEVYFLTGGGLFFFLLKVLHRMVSEKPHISGGFALLSGYIRARFSGEKRLVSQQEADFYSKQLNRRIWYSLTSRLRSSSEERVWSCQ
jgi:glycosyltransferase involved in cell wall biosynthesis